MANVPVIQTESIDGVIQSLNTIISWARDHGSRAGYFAALYRGVTLKVKRGIQTDLFEEPQRMEAFDTVFARRYLDAFENYQQKKPVSESWKKAFDAASSRRPVVLQHLLLGMNAHINLDLGIAAAQIAPGSTIYTLRADFMKINDILASMIPGVEAQLTRVWPMLEKVNRITRKVDDSLIHFSMMYARNHAWKVAEELAHMHEADRERRIELLDREACFYAGRLLRPGFLLSAALLAVRLTEKRPVSAVIDILQDPGRSPKLI